MCVFMYNTSNSQYIPFPHHVVLSPRRCMLNTLNGYTGARIPLSEWRLPVPCSCVHVRPAVMHRGANESTAASQAVMLACGYLEDNSNPLPQLRLQRARTSMTFIALAQHGV